MPIALCALFMTNPQSFFLSMKIKEHVTDQWDPMQALPLRDRVCVFCLFTTYCNLRRDRYCFEQVRELTASTELLAACAAMKIIKL